MENVNVGSGIGKGDGDHLRTAMVKINSNFSELDQNKQSKVEGEFDLVGASPAINITQTSSETIAYWTLNTNSTFSVAIVNGRALTMFITKGANTLNFPSNVKWISGSAPTLQATGFNIIELFASRGVIYASFIGNILP